MTNTAMEPVNHFIFAPQRRHLVGWAGNILFLLLLVCAPAAAQTLSPSPEPKITPAETAEVRNLARQFTGRVVDSTDVSTAIKDLYFRDFIQRYCGWRAKRQEDEREAAYFTIGQEFKRELLDQVDAGTWQRFYIAATNTWLVGWVAQTGPEGIPAGNDGDLILKVIEPVFRGDPSASDPLVPPNPTDDDAPPPIRSKEELLHHLVLTENVATQLRQDHRTAPLVESGQAALRANLDEFAYEAWAWTDETPFFGFPPGTRFVSVTTPVGLCMITTRDGDRLRIVWTDLHDD